MGTAQKAKSFLRGNKLYQQRARKALPLLIAKATANQTMFYFELADELEINNPRNLNYVLGSIGNTLQELSEERGYEIPPINLLVLNKRIGLPGEGVEKFIPKEEFSKLTPKEKQLIVDRLLHEVYTYPHWNRVLAHCNLSPQPVKDNSSLSLFDAIQRRQGNEGESEFHQNLKSYICSNPDVVGLPKNITGKTEYSLPSGDTVDVLFQLEQEWVAVEVKSRISDDSDIVRGLFQCVKYQAVIEAYQIVIGCKASCHVLLAMENQFPTKLLQMKNLLGIEVIDKLRGHSQT
ncbi:hypothetical protein H6G80_11400 [Nostoc sp. FACHB-87]|uniref:hypothetical protein n=1 Tax=Nostocaceae TaxID=1162 RepID=UPI00168A0678|nr:MULTISPECIES: hypothetical protein [Nostocaceae]MBD2454687.1 hypothetical protein [Nostoc sp. FACHB-87]MBD2475894.1 hypothetical protein [Anabaena sp. FACHB-83]